MPISLTYINLSTRGSEPRRPDAEIGTVCVETVPSPRMSAPPAAAKQPLTPHPRAEAPCVTSSLTSFTDWRWCTGQHKNCVALRPPCGLSNHRPLLASDDFQGPRGLKQKRKLSPGPATSGRKPDPVTRAHHTYSPAPPVRASPSRSEHRSRNNYRVPFRHCIRPIAFMPAKKSSGLGEIAHRALYPCTRTPLGLMHCVGAPIGRIKRGTDSLWRGSPLPSRSSFFSDMRNTWDTGSLSLGSGLTHPCSTDVDMEPFSTSVNEVLS